MRPALGRRRTQALIHLSATACVILVSVPLGAQSRTIVSDAHRCTTCVLTLEHVASLGKLSDPELIGEVLRPSVQHDTRGRFVVAATIPRTEILVYDSTGTYLHRWGRAGDGPGEFRYAWELVLLPDDSVLVVDWNASRITVLDSAGRYARSHQIPLRPLDLAVLPSGALIASATSYTAERIGYPLHRFTPDGVVQASFGGEHPVLLSRPSAAQRVIAAAGNGVWATRPDRYEVEYWTAAGERTAVLDRVCDWFPDRDTEGAGSNREPPSPFLIDLYADPNGLLWTLSTVADKAWQPFSPSDHRSYSERLNGFNDSMVEIIDPRTGELLASQRFPWTGQGFTNDGLIVSHRAGPYGTVVLDVWRGSLTRTAENTP